MEESLSQFQGRVAEIVSSHQVFLLREVFRRLAGRMDPVAQDQI